MAGKIEYLHMVDIAGIQPLPLLIVQNEFEESWLRKEPCALQILKRGGRCRSPRRNRDRNVGLARSRARWGCQSDSLKRKGIATHNGPDGVDSLNHGSR